ncbi:hypothetical protein EUGRSUZ_C02421 [Eucalyptus grandis]|uniref:Uncharacterized protein n=2 Tax=Eucalyptus grandis TaxID=71139 RepID=A0ACC3LFN0_EUCGR|nr:hypothetical protein EUGRSUZ_C02421 [Eucalyptus grandis]
MSSEKIQRLTVTFSSHLGRVIFVYLRFFWEACESPLGKILSAWRGGRPVGQLMRRAKRRTRLLFERKVNFFSTFLKQLSMCSDSRSGIIQNPPPSTRNSPAVPSKWCRSDMGSRRVAR